MQETETPNAQSAAGNSQNNLSNSQNEAANAQNRSAYAKLDAAKRERGNLRRKLTNLERFLVNYNALKYQSLLKHSKELEVNLRDFERCQTIIENCGFETLNEDGIEDARSDYENRHFAVYNIIFNILTPISQDISQSSSAGISADNGLNSQIRDLHVNLPRSHADVQACNN